MRVHPLLILFCVFWPAGLVLAAISANTQWNVQTDGNDTNGGGFVAGGAGTDYSLVAAKRSGATINTSTADVVSTGTTLLTTATGSLTSALTGNVVYLQGGSGTLTGGWYQATYVGSTSFTVDRNVGTGTGITCNIGGALASPGQASTNLTTDGQSINIKSGTYTISSSGSNSSGACMNIGYARVSVIGYGSTPFDMGTKPVIIADGTITNFTLIGNVTNLAAFHLFNMELNGNSRTGSRGLNWNGYFANEVRNCAFRNFTNRAVYFLNDYGDSTSDSSFTGNSGTYACQSLVVNNCVAIGNTYTPFRICGTAYNTLAINNTGSATNGFDFIEVGATGNHLVAFGNGKFGFNLNTYGYLVQNSIAVSNGSFGFYGASYYTNILDNCAAGLNGGGTNNFASIFNSTNNFGSITLTVDPFVSSASLNFALNNTTGGGASCRAASAFRVLPELNTIGYSDIGAVQHQDSGGGIVKPGMTGGFGP
jgi:hypothetical protein